jgi:hypothetical protein
MVVEDNAEDQIYGGYQTQCIRYLEDLLKSKREEFPGSFASGNFKLYLESKIHFQKQLILKEFDIEY